MSGMSLDPPNVHIDPKCPKNYFFILNRVVDSQDVESCPGWSMDPPNVHIDSKCPKNYFFMLNRVVDTKDVESCPVWSMMVHNDPRVQKIIFCPQCQLSPKRDKKVAL